jgi:hypothetical protein
MFLLCVHPPLASPILLVPKVLKPGGKIVFTFLDFRIPSYWPIFETYVNDPDPHKVLVQFLSRDAAIAWSNHLGLRVVEIHDGDKPHIKLDEPIKGEKGQEVKDLGMLGQSVCILTTD